MPTAAPPRVQFVISGKFIALILIAAGLLTAGYYYYQKQLQIQNRFRPLPYFVSTGTAIVRPCNRCVDGGRLKPQSAWKIGQPTEIPANERRWFLAVEDPPAPVNVLGVLMVPVYPALQSNPTFGFDQSQMVLVLYHGLQPMSSLEQPSPAPVVAPAVPRPTAADQAQPEESEVKIERLAETSWRVEVPADDEWHDTGIPVFASQQLIVQPTFLKTYGPDEGHWKLTVGEHQYSIPEDNDSPTRGFKLDLSEDLPFVSGPDWTDSLTLRVPKGTDPTFSLDIGSEFQALVNESHRRTTTEPWFVHVQRHQEARSKAEELLNQP